jgi:hypothetical protein
VPNQGKITEGEVKTKVVVVYWVADFLGWRERASGPSVASLFDESAAAGSDSMSLVGAVLVGAPLAGASEFFSTGPAPVAGLEAYETLRSAASEILLSSVTNDSPHHALWQVSD